MDFFKNIFRREADRSPAPKKKEAGGGSVPSRRIYINNAGKALEVAAFNHAVNLRSTTAARASLWFERKTPAGTWEPFTKGSEEYRHLNWLLNVRPNDRMTALQCWKRVYELRDLEGCAGLLLRKNAGSVDSIVPVSLSWNMTDNTYTATSYEYGKTWMKVGSDEVIVVRGPYSPGYDNGRSMVNMMRNTLSLAATAEAMCLDVVSKGGTFKAIIKQEESLTGLQGLATIDDEEMQKHTDTLSEQMADGKDFLYDSSAASITPITQSFQDLQIDSQRNKTIEDIARFMGIPLPLMFCSTNAVYKSIDDAWHTFKQLTIDPMLEEVRQELTAKLLTESEGDRFRFRFDTSALCLDSDSNKATTARTKVEAGIMTVNEARSGFGLPPVPGGDTLSQKLADNTITANDE